MRGGEIQGKECWECQVLSLPVTEAKKKERNAQREKEEKRNLKWQHSFRVGVVSWF